MYALLFILLIKPSFSNNLPGKNALSGDQVLPAFNSNKKTRFNQEDQVLSNIERDKIKNALDKMGIKDDKFRSRIEASRQQFQNIKSGNFQPPPIQDKVKIIKSSPIKSPPRGIEKRPKVRKSLKKIKKLKRPLPSAIQVYTSLPNYYESPETITIPSAALTPATLMAGVEVSTERRMVDIQINYAFVGPNGAVVDMTDCHTWIEVWGNYNTERIYGETKSISCRAPSGKTFDIPISGQIRDAKDEYVGIKAKLVTRGKVAAAALNFLQEGTKQFGNAMAAAQVTTEVVSGGQNNPAEKGQNITGSNSKYILGETISGATGGFLQWWIDYYKSLSPTLAVAPGTKVYFSVKGEVQIPKEFFEELNKKKSPRFNTNQTLTLQGEGQ